MGNLPSSGQEVRVERETPDNRACGERREGGEGPNEAAGAHAHRLPGGGAIFSPAFSGFESPCLGGLRVRESLFPDWSGGVAAGLIGREGMGCTPQLFTWWMVEGG